MAAMRKPSGGGGGRAVSADIHESLKSMMFGSAESACDVHFDKGVPCPADVYGVQDAYLELDSYSKNPASDMAKGVLAFNFNVAGPTTDDAIGTRTEVPTVIELLLEAFTVGLPDDLWDKSKAEADVVADLIGATAATGSDPTGTALTHPFGQLPYGERATVQFQEFGRQARVGRDPHAKTSRDHHVECDAAMGTLSDRLKLTPLAGERGYYVFVDPIRDIHGLTVVLRGVDRPLSIPTDTFDAVPTVDTGDLLFTWSSNFGTSASAMPPLSEDDRIYVRGFATDAGARFDAYINRSDGHLVGASPTASAFRLKPGFSGVPAITVSSSTVTVSVAKNRVRMSLRVRSVVGRLTNYISP